MNKLSIVTTFLMTLATAVAFAAPTQINMGNVVNQLNGDSFSQYQMKINYANASAFTSDSNSKLFGAWKKCFTRTENVPYSPFAPYNYHSLRVNADASQLFQPVDADKTIVVNEAAVVNLLENLEQQLNASTNGQCDIEATIQFEVLAYVPALNDSVRSILFVSKQNGKAVVTFTKWTADMSEALEINEYLPNQTPVEIGFPY
ncbi:hypothetical protein D3C87_1134090 [compost metagenome]